MAEEVNKGCETPHALEEVERTIKNEEGEELIWYFTVCSVKTDVPDAEQRWRSVKNARSPDQKLYGYDQ